MMKNYIVFLIALSMTSVVSAQNFKRYAFKSGVIEYQFEGKTTGTELLYFDEYGKKEAKYTNTVTKMFGVKTAEKKITIMEGAKLISYDENTGTKTVVNNPIFQSISENEDMDYEEFAQQTLKSLGYEKVGTSTVLGKSCDVWDGMGKIYGWKGLSLKVEMNVMGLKFTQTATNMKLDVSIPSSKFKVPDGLTTSVPTPSGNNSENGMKSVGSLFKGFGKKNKSNDEDIESNGLGGLMKMFGEAAEASGEELDEDEVSFEDIPELIEEMKRQLKEGEDSMCGLNYSEFKKKIKASGAPEIEEKELKETYRMIQELCKE